MRPFVVVAGLPGSGKSTLARRIAAALALPLIDKDDILAGLFDTRGIGDATWRRVLSRESDRLLRDAAEGSNGAVLVSFWHSEGMPVDSGTPIDWLAMLSDRVITVRCVCPVTVAADRFRKRRRHPGHLDDQRTLRDLIDSIEAVAALPALDIGHSIDVDTSSDVDLDAVVAAIRRLIV